MVRVALLGCGLIGDSYAEAILGNRSRDRIDVVYSRSEERRGAFQKKWGIPHGTCNWREAIEHPEIDLVVVATPNHLHEACVVAAAEAGKGVLCTKPLGRTRLEAERMLQAVDQAGVFHGYLEDLVYTPKTLKALQTVASGALGKVLWVRSRETHPGPHSEWFWDKQCAGGGAIVDLGCHCIEIGRSFIGKQIRPVEVMCWGDTQVHQIESEDHAIGLVRYENGAIGQFEVSWSFRGGMDLRDEVVGTDGTLWLNHWLRTGFEVFTALGTQESVAEKSETSRGWMFPVGDEAGALGYRAMFQDMFDSYEASREPRESFRDGVIVNAIVDACYRSMQTKRWESIEYGDVAAVNLLESPASKSNAEG
jgi:predicted dehydrogenase